MISVDDCLRFAAECEEMAEAPGRSEDREAFLKLASLWRELAEAQAEVALQ